MPAVVDGEPAGALGGTGGLFVTVEQVHDRTDDQGKEDGTDSPGDTQLGAKHLGRHHDGHDVDRRPRVEKGDGCAEPGTAPVDAAE